MLSVTYIGPDGIEPPCYRIHLDIATLDTLYIRANSILVYPDASNSLSFIIDGLSGTFLRRLPLHILHRPDGDGCNLISPQSVHRIILLNCCLFLPANVDVPL